MAAYDSRPDTLTHIDTVRGFMRAVIDDLCRRARVHDQSKLVEPERAVFDRVTPKLRGLTYGSAEYKASLAEMGEGLAHHYAVNDHHPEHFPNGIADMNLAQVVEMLCDWKAATMRHADGDLRRSITQNAERFGYGDEMTRLLMNTAQSFGWLAPSEAEQAAAEAAGPEPVLGTRSEADDKARREALADADERTEKPRPC